MHAGECDLLIGTGLSLHDIRQADAERQQELVLEWRELPGREAYLRQRAPELVARTGVVLLQLGRTTTGGGPAYDEHEISCQEIFEH